MNLKIAGELLKRRRLKKGLTLQDVSNKSQLTIGYISHIETGISKNPSINSLISICVALEWSFYSLVSQVERFDSEMSKKKQTKSLSLSTTTC